MTPRWLLSHARGYLELGLVEEAVSELAQLPSDQLNGDEVLALRTIIFQEQANWITFAYATRRAVSLGEAEAILREAELRHPQEATIQFNLGCYACLRGDLPEARRRVDLAIALDPQFRAAAGTDPDLALLRPALPE
jgi:tetratricopeptide (TPR) repeat protein